MKQPWFRMKAAPLHLSFAASRIFWAVSLFAVCACTKAVFADVSMSPWR